MATDREVTVLINARLKQAGQNPFAPLEQQAIKSDAVIAQRLNHVQDKLREINTVAGFAGKGIAKSLGFIEADEGIDRVLNRIQDRLSKPLTNVGLNRMLGDVKRLESIGEQAFGNVIGGVERAGSGAFGAARGFALLASSGEDGDKQFQAMLKTLFKFQAAYDIIKGGAEIFRGVASAVSNYQRAVLAAEAATTGLAAVQGVAGAASAGGGFISSTASGAIGSTIGNTASTALVEGFKKATPSISAALAADLKGLAAKSLREGIGTTAVAGVSGAAARGGVAGFFNTAVGAGVSFAGALLPLAALASAGALIYDSFASAVTGRRSIWANLGIVFGESAALEFAKGQKELLSKRIELEGRQRESAQARAGIAEQAEDAKRPFSNAIFSAGLQGQEAERFAAERNRLRPVLTQRFQGLTSKAGLVGAFGNEEGGQKFEDSQKEAATLAEKQADSQARSIAKRATAEAEAGRLEEEAAQNKQAIAEKEIERDKAFANRAILVARNSRIEDENADSVKRNQRGISGLPLSGTFARGLSAVGILESPEEKLAKRVDIVGPGSAGQKLRDAEADLVRLNTRQGVLASERKAAAEAVVNAKREERAATLEILKADRDIYEQQVKTYAAQKQALEGQLRSREEQFGDADPAKQSQILATLDKAKRGGVDTLTREEREQVRPFITEDLATSARNQAQKLGLPKALEGFESSNRLDVATKGEAAAQQALVQVKNTIEARGDFDAKAVAGLLENSLKGIFKDLEVIIDRKVDAQLKELARKDNQAVANKEATQK